MRALFAAGAMVLALASCEAGTTIVTATIWSVEVTPSSGTVHVGWTLQLTATAKDARGNVLSDRAISWSSSNSAVATVGGSGMVTGTGEGDGTISATSEGISGTASVTVTPAPVASVEVSPVSATVEVGTTLQLTATAKDAVGNVLSGRAISWSSSNSAVATVSSSGLVTGVFTGTATIAATSEGISGTATVTVTPEPVASVEVNPLSATVEVGTTLQLTATAKDAGGNVLSGRAINWSSTNSAVATVSSSGLVMGVFVGEARITATSEGVSGTATVTVTPEPVASVEVSPVGTTVEVGATIQLTATTRAAGGDVLSGRTIDWSSSNSTATVSSSGLVTGVFAGEATITATSEGVSGTATVTVKLVEDGQFVLIPGGSFEMGSTNGGSDERPVHTVNITKPFYIQKTEVTQEQWRDVMGSNPTNFPGCGDNCPVDGVGWDDIQEFLSLLNTAEPGKNYRLPTEAEWEYAARAGTTGDYGGNGVLDDMGWYGGNGGGGNAGDGTHPVAQKQPNAWGLYDMHGNLWEWVQDWYSATYYVLSPLNDPTGPVTGSPKVLRGGGWSIGRGAARSASRNQSVPNGASRNHGFRLARTP